MKTELCAVRAYYRHMPERKSDPVKADTNFRLWDERFGDELEAALREALAVGDGSFPIHAGIV